MESDLCWRLGWRNEWSRGGEGRKVTVKGRAEEMLPSCRRVLEPSHCLHPSSAKFDRDSKGVSVLCRGSLLKGIGSFLPASRLADEL